MRFPVSEPARGIGGEERTVKGVHERVARNRRTRSARRGRERVVLANLVPAHDMLDGLVRREIHGMRRPYIIVVSCAPRCGRGRAAGIVPAPTMTLDMPRHKLRIPSLVAMRYVPWITPL